jgi:beta-1,4-N-acetylglucosaminyltransferase
MVRPKNKLKICLVASAGGHITELLKLQNSWQGYETFCITTTDVVAKKLRKYGNVNVVGECNREHPFRVMLVLFRCIDIILRQRPDVVISTGAAVGCITCFLGKLFKAKVVWVDSIANVERISLSGWMVKHIADLFLVQWPELQNMGRDIEYVGSVI